MVRAFLVVVAAFLAPHLTQAGPHVQPGHGVFDVSGAIHQPAGTHQGSPAASGQDGGSQLVIELIPCTGGCPVGRCGPGEVAFWRDLVGPDGSQLGSPTLQCRHSQRVVTPAEAFSAFRRVGVPTPVLHVQPVHGRTLVNLRTDFYATGGAAFSRTVRLLGQRVTLRIRVARYLFRFGDGHRLATTDPGAAYPDLRVTHVYLRAGVVRPSLVTTWAASYRIGTGSWRSVEGTVTRDGPPRRLRVVTATPVLTDPGS